MIRKITFFAISAVFFLTTLSFGKDRELKILRSERSTFVNHDCEKNKTCGLKSVRYVVERYQIVVGGSYGYGTRFLALYETDSVDHLKDYVFVQFIRGCQYESRMKNGKITTDFSFVLRIGGLPPTTLCFPDWVIDSGEEEDPSYCAQTGRSRQYWCHWKKNKESDLFEKKGTYTYAFSKPERPYLYMTDRPSGGLVYNETAINASEEFRTCIYRAVDVPRKLTPYKTDFAAPIHCFNWSNSFVYSFDKKEFEEKPDVIAQCEEAKKLQPPK